MVGYSTSMPTHALFLTHTTLDGRRDEVHAVWSKHMAPAISANPDHLAYFYCYDLGDPNVIRVFQQYRSADAATAFLRSDAYAAYLGAVEPLLTGPPEVHAAEPTWTKAGGTSTAT